MNRRNVVLLLAMDAIQKNVLGYIIFQFNSVAMSVQKIAVQERNRGQGVGTGLLDAGIVMALTKRKVEHINLHVSPTNEKAPRLYRKFGFAIVATLNDYYLLGSPAYKMELDRLDARALWQGLTLVAHNFKLHSTQYCTTGPQACHLASSIEFQRQAPASKALLSKLPTMS